MTSAPHEVYTHGHDEPVLRSHRWRTAANSAGYLLPVLTPDQRLLDVGCGPGTLTCDLAGHVREVVGLDRSPDVVRAATAEARAARASTVTFTVGDVYALPFADASFDVVHAHQVLQHLQDPVAALREMRRVARPGGYVAVRDSDYSAMTWYPASPGLDRWREVYLQVTAANGADADAGRKLGTWVHAAGFDPARTTVGAGVWCYASPAERTWWSGLWADRVAGTDLHRRAVELAIADEAELAEIADAWRAWGAAPDGWFAVLHGEVLAQV